jgi:protoporphyrinogen oxidase
MGDEFLRRPRMSRIYWNGRFLDYPLRGPDVMRKLGPVELTRATASFLAASVRRNRREDSFEDWVCNRFGRRLFELFFRSYTEKVWGVPTSEIRAEWAAQRIKGLSFTSAARAAFVGNRGNRVKSLITEFDYPRLGPGQMWDAMTASIERLGGEVRTGCPVQQLVVRDGRVAEVVAGGERLRPRHVISSLPLRAVVGLAGDAAGDDVTAAARGLRYRDFLTVALVIDSHELFPDNWIYIHQPGVRVLRIQNFRSWSPWMIPNDTDTSIGMEYFCFEGDELWNMADDDLVAMARRELQQLKLADASKVKFGFVVRVHKAYPIYDVEYAERVATIRGWLETIGNLTQVGRNGLHRYNNSDHSMLTAMRAVDNILLGTNHDIWAVNAESVYHEEHQDPEQPYRDPPETPAMEQPLASER